jgi:hypothetical protein
MTLFECVPAASPGYPGFLCHDQEMNSQMETSSLAFSPAVSQEFVYSDETALKQMFAQHGVMRKGAIV